MGSDNQRLKRRKNLLNLIDSLIENATTTLVIHYSCERFNVRENGTPRITTIAVRNLASCQTDSFSIHQIAEEQSIFADITNHYDALEEQMLGRFFDFVRIRQHCNWVHWNMRNGTYGFAAIEHRYRVLGGLPITIAEDKRFDFARALADLYGDSYIEDPRLESIIKKNNITDIDFLTGIKEAEAFENKDFVGLCRSTLRKVDAMAKILEKTSNKSLKTNSTLAKQYGFTLSGLTELVKEHWIVKLIGVGGVVLGFVLNFSRVLRIINGNNP